MAVGCRKPEQRAQHATNHDTRTGAKQHQPLSGRTCARTAANPDPAGYRRAAVWMEECASGGYLTPAGSEQLPFGWTSARPPEYPAPAGYETAAVGKDECAPRGYPAPAGYEKPPSGWTSVRPAAMPRTCNTAHATHSTTHRASTPGYRSQVAQDTAHPAQHTKQAH